MGGEQVGREEEEEEFLGSLLLHLDVQLGVYAPVPGRQQVVDAESVDVSCLAAAFAEVVRLEQGLIAAQKAATATLHQMQEATAQCHRCLAVLATMGKVEP